MIVVVPGIGPEQDWFPRLLEVWPSALEAARCELREAALRCDPRAALRGVADAGQLHGEVGEARRETGNGRGQMCPFVHEAKGVVAQMTAVVLVVVGEEFGLVGGDVDIHRALAFAGFAGKA